MVVVLVGRVCVNGGRRVGDDDVCPLRNQHTKSLASGPCLPGASAGRSIQVRVMRRGSVRAMRSGLARVLPAGWVLGWRLEPGLLLVVASESVVVLKWERGWRWGGVLAGVDYL